MRARKVGRRGVTWPAPCSVFKNEDDLEEARGNEMRGNAHRRNQGPNLDLRVVFLGGREPPVMAAVGGRNPGTSRQTYQSSFKSGVSYVNVSGPCWGWASIFQPFWPTLSSKSMAYTLPLMSATVAPRERRV